jgi:flagellar FliL protein
MAKKKKDEAAKEPESGESERPAENADPTQESAATGGKKRKLVILLGIASIGLAATGIGGFFLMKTFGGSKTELAAKDLPEGAATEENSKAEGAPAATAEGTTAPKSAPESGATPAATPKAEASAKDASGAPAAGTSEQTPETPSPDQFGDTIDLPKMELNLGNPLENRFLRFGLSLEYHGGDAQRKELERRMPQVRDLVISIISRKTRMELLSAEGKESFRKQLKNTLNELLASPVTNVYFTEFLVE